MKFSQEGVNNSTLLKKESMSLKKGNRNNPI